MDKKKFYILDGNNLLFRAYYALPLLSNAQGEYCNGVFGFTNMIIHIIEDEKPDYIAVCFDKGKTFRHEAYLEYKAQRKPAPQELLSQFPIMENLLSAMHIKVVSGMGLEADDLIGCLSRMYDTDNVIVTADKDCLQLINDNTRVLVPHKGVSDSELVDTQKLKEKYGIAPYQIVELKSLMGDPSDNIPGVKGVGEKTALKLLEDYTTLDGVYNNIDNISGKLKDKLVESKDMAYMSHMLATIVTDKKLPFDIDDFTYSFPFNGDVYEFFKKYQFKSLLKKDELFDTNTQVADTKSVVSVEKVEITDKNTLEKIVEKMLNFGEFSVYFGNNNVSLYDGKTAYVVPLKKDLISLGFDLGDVLDSLKNLLQSNAPKIVFDSKKLMHDLLPFGVSLQGVAFDVMLARYVLNSGGKNNVTFDDVVMESDAQYDVDAVNLYAMYHAYKDRLEDTNLSSVYYDIELPLTAVLFDMEKQGFKLDRVELNNQKLEYEKRLEDLSHKIFEYAGENFNINSPKKLGEILFDKLGLNIPSNKKKSTNSQILDEIIDKHPIVKLIVEYRLLSKIYGTYLVPYTQLIDGGNDKIYTLFNQLNTTTGRLSSSEPNLQNIPVRTAEGKNIRKIFVPSDPRGYIVSADYSQIELRLLAAFSGDEKLIDAFNHGVDIHSLTASEIFGTPIDAVTPDMRRSAKVINFGIVYGMSDYGLSQDIGIPVFQAKEYIKQYFARYPKIGQYMDSNVQSCKAQGYVTTLFGRRRYIPEINAPQYITRQFGERAAKNMPLQGSASDIIKIAMIKVHQQLANNHLSSKLILQVHDELIVDTAPDELDAVCKILKNCMESVVSLPVKLSVNVAYGHNWYDAK